MKFFSFLVVLSFIFWACEKNESTAPEQGDGLSAYYPFNGNAKDESGNGNDGVVNGAVLVKDRFGNDSSAFYLNGIADYIEFPQTFIFHEQGDGSFFFWINHDSVGHESIFWTRGDDTDKNRFNIYTNYEDKLFGVDYRSPSGERHKIFGVDTDISTWIFIGITRSGNTYSLYVNGTKISDFTDSNPDLPTYTGKWFCGKRHNFMYNGVVDDIRIYNRALTEQEINNLYHEGNWDES